MARGATRDVRASSDGGSWRGWAAEAVVVSGPLRLKPHLQLATELRKLELQGNQDLYLVNVASVYSMPSWKTCLVSLEDVSSERDTVSECPCGSSFQDGLLQLADRLLCHWLCQWLTAAFEWRAVR